MPKFDVVDCFVALGGDRLNTVPKSNVTAAEIAVLQVIHQAADAVHDITPTGSVERSQKVERERLKTIYGGARGNDGVPYIEKLYPGAAARVFETLDELDLVDELYAPVGRVSRSGSTERRAEAKAASDEGADLASKPDAEQEQPVEDDEDAASGLTELPADPADQRPSAFE